MFTRPIYRGPITPCITILSRGPSCGHLRPQLSFTLEFQVVFRFLAAHVCVGGPTNQPTNQSHHLKPSPSSKPSQPSSNPSELLKRLDSQRGPHCRQIIEKHFPSFTGETGFLLCLKIHHLGFLCSLHCQSFHAFGLIFPVDNESTEWERKMGQLEDFTKLVQSFKKSSPEIRVEYGLSVQCIRRETPGDTAFEWLRPLCFQGVPVLPCFFGWRCTNVPTTQTLAQVANFNPPQTYVH